ncbi:MAG TPA: class I SAM-dependent methyltransferase [Firmicutes bacterium]|jgi:SAM-dependent methyltransferase|nr:hypothetical protein [Bacillota bacterium]HHT43438.1 class I SAM-dependent methyltransferase [Bacillota bacterium]
MNLFQWIEAELAPVRTTSTALIYDDLESQSGRSLPLIYQPFDCGAPGHWADRGALFDFLYTSQSEGKLVLDFGPGDGWPSLPMAPYVEQVVGVDASQRRAEVCADLFQLYPEQERPCTLQGVDRIVAPVVKIVSSLPAPVELDPPLTAVK